VPALVDTTIRLLGQEPLAGVMPTAEQLRLAEILDTAGFAYLEVSGGGCFDAAVKRGVESPWERIRAIRARTRTPLGLALRGRFLVGARPVGGDFVRRFVASAAESGIDVFRLHDPLNDVSNLREASEAITAAGREFDARLVYSPGPTGETDALVGQSRRLLELGAARILLHDPSGSLEPYRVQELVEAIREASGLPVGLYCQGAGGTALSAAIEAARAGADLIACSVYPIALVLHRASGEAVADALAGLDLDTGVDVDVLWRAADLLDEHMGDQPVTPLAPRIATRAARHSLPAGLIAALDAQLRRYAAGDRLDEAIAELTRIRSEAGWPPLASPIGQVLASQALIHVLGAERYQTVVDELRDLLAGRYGAPPGEISPAVRRAVELVTNGAPAREGPALDELREQYDGVAASEEELLLVGLFGEDAEPLLESMVGTFYRSASPGAPPFVEEGDPIGSGQTLCILEAMKLMNEVKAEQDGIVRRIHVENAAPVEYGQLLFELEPLNGRPPLL
jgi:pyruvate/oxaloacetate carboxyltransferase